MTVLTDVKLKRTIEVNGKKFGKGMVISSKAYIVPLKQKALFKSIDGNIMMYAKHLIHLDEKDDIISEAIDDITIELSNIVDASCIYSLEGILAKWDIKNVIRHYSDIDDYYRPVSKITIKRARKECRFVTPIKGSPSVHLTVCIKPLA